LGQKRREGGNGVHAKKIKHGEKKLNLKNRGRVQNEWLKIQGRKYSNIRESKKKNEKGCQGGLIRE